MPISIRIRRWIVPSPFTSILVAGLLLVPDLARGGTSTGFTTQVSPRSQTNATEPSVAVDPSDGTVWVAWQASGTHVARSDDGGRSWHQMLSESDVGDVDVRIGGPTACMVPSSGCLPKTRRVYVTSLEETPLATRARTTSPGSRAVATDASTLSG